MISRAGGKRTLTFAIVSAVQVTACSIAKEKVVVFFAEKGSMNAGKGATSYTCLYTAKLLPHTHAYVSGPVVKKVFLCWEKEYCCASTLHCTNLSESDCA